MADGCHLEIRKIAICRLCFDRLPRNLARLRIFTFHTLWAIKILSFKIQVVRQHNFKYKKNREWLCWYCQLLLTTNFL